MFSFQAVSLLGLFAFSFLLPKALDQPFEQPETAKDIKEGGSAGMESIEMESIDAETSIEMEASGT